MVDIHTHILPGIDDGSSSMRETIKMLLLAYAQGVRTVIATPHSNYYKKTKSKEELEILLAEVEERIQKTLPDFTLLLGQEILYFPGMVEALRENRLLTLNDTEYVLVEFRAKESWTTIYQGVRKLLMAQYIPVIAHAERYFALREEGRFNDLIQAGALIQMNYSSLIGNFLWPEVRWCRRQVLEGNVDLLATDMHNMQQRRPQITEALDWLERKGEHELIARITAGNAQNIMIKSKDIGYGKRSG